MDGMGLPWLRVPVSVAVFAALGMLARHYLVIHAVCGTFRLRERISAYAQRLQGKGFTRIHRCYVVNEAWVRARTATAVELAGGEILPIGRRFRVHADA